jgi:hypothetical protein
MSAQVTREHADKIIRKLKAKPSSRTSTHHKHYDVLVDDQVVLTFGVSHTAKKGKPQSHLPADLHLNAYNTKELANCNLTADQYIEILARQGLI